ncbi:MAG TPA: urate hydroxylase PuuD [Gaiellaceae bacterium]
MSFLAVDPYVWDWGDLLFRWLHAVAAIVWIGTSFYFVALDNHLEPPRDPRDADRGIGGETWEIHGGGFYRIEKFRVAPRTLPEPLHWFKWEAYTTWLSGFALLVVLYYVHASSYLVDPSVADLASWEAILVSAGGLVLAWLVYDVLCRLLGGDERVLAAAVFGFVVLSAWVMSQLLAPRAAFLEVGAMIGTMMVGNVFFVIIPAHWELVRAKQAGRVPDPRWNLRGKQRSVHNNYLTLPVVFAMLSNHFTFVYEHAHAWIALVAIMAIGGLVRHFFNLRHAGRTALWVPPVALAGLAGVAVLVRPASAPSVSGPPASFAQANTVIRARCVPCHSAQPTQPGFASAPKGVRLDTRTEIEAQASAIERQAVVLKAMPLGNVTHMTQAERDLLARWLRSR